MRFHVSLLASIVALALLTIGFSEAATQEPEPSSRQLHSAVQWRGSSSSIEDRRLLLIADDAAFRTLWIEHRGASVETNALEYPVVPAINFDQFMVVAYFRGRSWNCNGEYITAIEMLGDVMRIRCDSSTFQTVGPDGGGRPVTPYGIWVVPKHDGLVRVEENVQNRIGGDPIWKEVASFDRAPIIGG